MYLNKRILILYICISIKIESDTITKYNHKNSSENETSIDYSKSFIISDNNDVYKCYLQVKNKKVMQHKYGNVKKGEAGMDGNEDDHHKNPNSNTGPSTSKVWKGPGPEFGVGNKKQKYKKNNKINKPKIYKSTHTKSNEGKGNDCDSDYKHYQQVNNNKEMHATNGNGNENNVVNIIMVNKGSSHIEKYLELIKNTIKDENPEIAILPESNLKEGEQTLNINFPEYNIESKFIPGLGYARITMMIKKSLTYSRMNELDDLYTSTIWIKVKTGKRDHLIIMGGYRQWTLPLRLGIPNSNHPSKQLERYNLIQKQINKALSTNCKVIVGWDSNLDTLESNDPLGRDDTRDMYEEYISFIDEKGLTRHITKPTWHRIGRASSCLDHLISNCPSNIDRVSQKPSLIADHELVRLSFHSKEIITKPQLMRIRNHNEISRDNILPFLINNERLLNTLSMSNIDRITNTIIEEFNAAGNSISPPKVIQIKKNHVPYHNEDARNLLKDADIQLGVAIARDDINEWRCFKNKRNQALNYINQLKTDYFTSVLNNSKDMWSSLKKLTKSNISGMPTRVNVNGVMTSSPAKIANSFNDFFFSKISKIRSGFSKARISPIEVLEKVIKKPTTTFTLPPITVKQCEFIITNMKSSHSVGFDGITSRMVK